MKLLVAFFRLIRWPNLVFIALTQFLFYICIVNAITWKDTAEWPPISWMHFSLLSFSSVLIAAGGYIINDYFDLNIDRINKPDKLIIGRIISRRWAMLLHIIISLAGIAIGFYVGMKIFHQKKWLIGLADIICVALLIIYSTTFKKQLLIGNVIISLLTAWVIFIITVVLKQVPNPLSPYEGIVSNREYLRIYKYTVLYAGFAFIISLIREVIKDIEDIEGDAKYNCKTMPVVWGIPASKVFVAVWIIVLVGALSIIQFYVLQIGWWMSSFYCFILVIIPLIFILKRLYAAQVSDDYHKLSSAVKLVMLAGILSMIFLRIV